MFKIPAVFSAQNRRKKADCRPGAHHDMKRHGDSGKKSGSDKSILQNTVQRQQDKHISHTFGLKAAKNPFTRSQRLVGIKPKPEPQNKLPPIQIKTLGKFNESPYQKHPYRAPAGQG